MGARQDLLLNVLYEVLNLALHLFHALAHLQNDGDAGNVHTKVAGQVQNELQPLQIFVGVKAGITFRTGRLKQPLALVETQSLWMDAVHLGYRRDHVCAFGAAFCHRGKFITLATKGAERHRRELETECQRAGNPSSGFLWALCGSYAYLRMFAILGCSRSLLCCGPACRPYRMIEQIGDNSCPHQESPEGE